MDDIFSLAIQKTEIEDPELFFDIEKNVIVHRPNINESKDYCVFGVLKTKLGLKIKDEMLSWLSPIYNVYVVEQEEPGKLFEYPALLFMKFLQIKNKKPCLYVHTKGAAHNNPTQKYVRRLWEDEFINHKDEYFSLVDTGVPTIACPFTGEEKITWLNGMVFNYEAANAIIIPPPRKRFYYEQLCRDSVNKENNLNINVIGRIYNDISVSPYGDYDNPLKAKAAAYLSKFKRS